MDADLLNETSEGQREEGAGGGSRELPEHSIDLIPVEGEKEGRGLGMKTIVCCAVPEQRFPVNRVLCWSGMVWFQFPAVLSLWLGGTCKKRDLGMNTTMNPKMWLLYTVSQLYSFFKSFD